MEEPTSSQQVELMPAKPRRSGIVYLVIGVLAGALVGGLATYAYMQKLNSDSDLSEGGDDSAQSLVAESTAPATASPAAIASATPTSTATPSQTASASTTDCATVLKPTLSNGGGAAGTYYYRLTITNSGTASCTVSSQPPILVPLDAAGKELGKVITDYDAKGVKSFTLKAGEKVYSLIGFPNSGNFDTATDCKAMKSVRVDINGGTTKLLLSNVSSLQPGYTDYFCKSSLSTRDFAGTPY